MVKNLYLMILFLTVALHNQRIQSIRLPSCRTTETFVVNGIPAIPFICGKKVMKGEHHIRCIADSTTKELTCGGLVLSGCFRTEKLLWHIIFRSEFELNPRDDLYPL